MGRYSDVKRLHDYDDERKPGSVHPPGAAFKSPVWNISAITDEGLMSLSQVHYLPLAPPFFFTAIPDQGYHRP
jgi:hypothetical protein